jgi:hypothetical protein
MNWNWEAVTAGATALAAIFTAAMTRYTRNAIIESQRQHRDTQLQSEAHHQDSLRPLVIFSPHDGIDPLDRSSLLQFDLTERTAGARLVQVFCRLHNAGLGPALNVRLHLRAMGIADYGSTHELAPLRIGESRGDTEHPLRFQMWLSKGFNDTDFQFAGNTIWELVIDYEDVFGNRFYTAHSKNPQLAWTVCGKGILPGGNNAAPFTEHKLP